MSLAYSWQPFVGLQRQLGATSEMPLAGAIVMASAGAPWPLRCPCFGDADAAEEPLCLGTAVAYLPPAGKRVKLAVRFSGCETDCGHQEWPLLRCVRHPIGGQER